MRAHMFSITTVFLLAVLLSANANAYIDPGTGSALIQGLIAALAAIGVTLKLYWYKILRFFRRRTGDVDLAADTDSTISEKANHLASQEKNDS